MASCIAIIIQKYVNEVNRSENRKYPASAGRRRLMLLGVPKRGVSRSRKGTVYLRTHARNSFYITPIETPLFGTVLPFTKTMTLSLLQSFR